MGRAQEGTEEKMGGEVAGARGTMETRRARTKQSRGHEKSIKGKKNKEEASMRFIAFWVDIYFCVSRLRYAHDGKKTKHVCFSASAAFRSQLGQVLWPLLGFFFVVFCVLFFGCVLGRFWFVLGGLWGSILGPFGAPRSL